MTSPEPTSKSTANPHSGGLEMDQSDYGRYLLYSRSEILFVLRSILQKGSLLSVHFDSGNAFFLTALLTLSDDGNWMYFDLGSDIETNQRALKSGKLVFTTSLDKVKIQFSVSRLQTSTFQGREVFAARVPESVLRLQRREYYRLTTPIAAPLVCRFVLAIDGARQRCEGTVVDISGGGVGLSLPRGDQGPYDTGVTLSDARIEIPDEGSLSTELCVRNAFPVSARGAQAHLRVGCEYVDLPGAQLAMVQRYITRIERERKARAAGLD